MGSDEKETMIDVKSLVKHFGNITAVNQVSFKVKKGEVLGFLGPNGAGKSTTMKMITCFIDPSEGDATVLGKSILDDPISVRKHIGYMPENAPLYQDMNVEEFLYFMADLRQIPPADRPRLIENVIKTVAIENVRQQQIETLSKGFKRRVSMAQALLHDPDVLILDEPTDGLDPNQKYEVRKLIRDLSKEKAIILSTHILEEVDAVCDKVIIIANGVLKFDGSAKEFKEKSQQGKVDDVFRAITTEQAVEGVNL